MFRFQGRFTSLWGYRFYSSLSSLVIAASSLGISITLCWASPPDIQTQTALKEKVASALSQYSSSFQHPGDDTEDTYVLGYHQHYLELSSSRSKEELKSLLLNPKTQYLFKKSSSADRLSAYLYQVKLPAGTLPSSFEFSLVPLLGYTDEELDSQGLPLLDRQNKIKLRMKIATLMNAYAQERHIPQLVSNLQGIEQAISHETSMDHKIILESQKLALTHEITQISNPAEKLKYITQKISPSAFQNYPPAVFIQILQEAQLVPPPLSESTQAATSFIERDEISATPEARNCIELGGQIQVYTKGQSEEALLCQFGEAGIGAGSLYQFKNKKPVQSIEAFLNFIPYQGRSSSEEISVIPYGKSENGSLSQFVLRTDHPSDQNLDAAMKLILKPSAKISEYCRQRSGKPTQLHHKKEGTDFKACIFSDFSGIDAKTLFAGPEAPSNAVLTQTLRSLQMK